jgi:aminoglycoside phosphotransferase (APT) family kinase protein
MLERVGEEIPALAGDCVAAVFLIAGGQSNLTYLLESVDGSRFVLRRPPLSDRLESAHDMSREWRYTRALTPTAVPVARARMFCSDPAVSDVDFYVMDHVEGQVLEKPDSARGLTHAARGRVGASAVEVLAALHALDPAALRLTERDLSRGTSYVPRQLDRWTRQLEAVRVPEHAALARVVEALRHDVPAERTGITHGDYRTGNLSVGPSGDLVAVFDWELATVGDTLTDLGWLVASWQEPGETSFVPIKAGPTVTEGFGTRDSLVEGYVAASGRDVPDLYYYEAFARWRMACIAVGVRHRYRSGAMGAEYGEPEELTGQIGRLAETALDCLARTARA